MVQRRGSIAWSGLILVVLLAFGVANATGSARVFGAVDCLRAWRVVPAPAVADGALHGAVARSARDAWAVGSVSEYGPSPDPRPLIEHWNGAMWTSVESAAPVGYLVDVAAASSTDAWAVGETRDGQGPTATWRSLLERWNGKAWRVVETKPPVDMRPRAVAAASTGDAWVVADGFGNGAAVLHWDGTAWSRSGSWRGISLRDVVALSPRDVWTVGQSAAGKPLALHWDGVRWRGYAGPVPRGVSDASLNAVAALSTNDVWAAGDWPIPESTFSRRPFVLHWNGRQWRASPPPAWDYPPGAIAVRAPAELFVTTSDASFSLYGAAGLLQHWQDGAWRVTKLRRGQRLDGLSTDPNGTLWAVGFSGVGYWSNVDNSGFPRHSTPLIERYGC